MNIENLTLSELFELRNGMILEGKNISNINRLISKKETEYSDSIILEDGTSATGGPAGAAGAASIGVGGGGVAYSSAVIGGMGAVVSAQPSTHAGQTISPGYEQGGGSVGSGDVSMPYNTGGTKVFQKTPAYADRKGTNRRRKNKMLAGLKSALSKRQDFTAGQATGKPKKIMNFMDFAKDNLNKVTKVNQ